MEHKTGSKDRRWVIGLAVVAMVVYALAWTCAALAGPWGLERLAPIGDAFNAATGLLTLIALGAAIWSVIMQGEELALQRREMSALVRGAWRAEVRKPYTELIGALGDLHDTVTRLIPMQGRPSGTPSSDEAELLRLGQHLVVKQSRGLRLVELTDQDPERRDLAAKACRLCEQSYVLIRGYLQPGDAIGRDQVQGLLHQLKRARDAANTLANRLNADLAAPPPAPNGAEPMTPASESGTGARDESEKSSPPNDSRGL